MPCKIQIKQKITSKIEASTNAALGKSLDVAQSIAREVNDEYKAPVVRFVQRGTDLIDRIINVPQNLIDKYYNSELALETEEARRVQREDARRAGEDYTDRYMFQLDQPLLQDIDGISIIDTEDIVSYEGTKGAAQYSREANVIKVNRKLLKQKFREKAWTNPRKLMEILNGEIVESYAEALPKDTFKTYNEWETFVIGHEYQHSTYSREDFNREFPNRTKGDYESEINRRVLRAQTDVRYSLKAVDILSSDRAIQMFAKGQKNGWPLSKILTELQIPKEQKQIILDKDITDREEIITSLLADNSYTVEINTAKQPETESLNRQIQDGEIDPSAIEYLNKDKQVNTQYYSNLTVPGGTNYTENEIATPAITPNIKGHAQFATDKGIGWFRSDDKSEGSTLTEAFTGDFAEDNLELEYDTFVERGLNISFSEFKKEYIKQNSGTPTKTRRILEVQSDLFQKGRNKKGLVSAGEISYQQQKEWSKEGLTPEQMNERQNQMPSNKFLQLLNQKGNWINFFIQSIVQDSAKKGYEKVLFPKGDTASKIEGHTTLEEFIKQNEDRIKELEKEEGAVTVKLLRNEDDSSYTKRFNNEEEFYNYVNQTGEDYRFITNPRIEINQLKEEIKRVEKDGFGALRPIYDFYDNRVSNILNKLYDVKEVTDEYGNTWSEVKILPEMLEQSIFLQRKTSVAKEASPEVISKVKEVIKKMGVNLQDLSEYAKNNPAIDESSINALVDLTAGIIAVSEGKEDVALTEEMVHIATAIIEQRNPKLITELISKVGRFKVYKDTLEQYKDNPAYQLENGKPNIRKIKKEAVDKLIADIIVNGDVTGELAQEENRSLIRRMWDAITDWFRGQYKKANIDIFSTTAKTVLGGEFEGSVLDLNSEELYYQLSDSQKDLQRRFAETDQVLNKVVKPEELDADLMDEEKSTNYYTILKDGEVKKVTKRVTDRVKDWYKRKFRNQKFTEQEKRDNKRKAEIGTGYHNMFEEIHARFFNTDGSRRPIPGPRPVGLNRVDDQVYTKLEKYYTDLVASFSENGKNPLVFSEVKIYDPREDEAGTIDLLIVEEDGTANIYDWKFMSVAKGEKDIAWYKQGAYNEQLRRYKEILISQYGVERIGKNRAIPILLDLKRENFQDRTSKLEVKGITIGSVNPKQIEPLTLTPVSEVSESTGYKAIDDLLKKLAGIYAQLGSRVIKDEDERQYKIERLNILSKAMRSLRAGQNIGPLVDAIESFRQEGEDIISIYKNTYKDKPATRDSVKDKDLSDFSDRIRTYIDFSQVFGTSFDSISRLLYTEGSEEFAIDEAERERLLNAKEGVNALRFSTEEIRINSEQIAELGAEFQDKFVGERNLVAGLSRPEAIIKSFTHKWFTGLSSMGLEATKVLSKLVNRAQAFANREALGEVNRLLEIRDKLKARGGNLKDVVLKVYQKDKEGSIVNKLIQRYRPEFFTEAKDNAKLAEEAKTTAELNVARQWLKDNIDIAAYKKEAAVKMEKELARVIQNTLGRDEEYRAQQLMKVRRTWDVSRNDFNGFDNPLIKKFPLPKWESEEYVELRKDPELFELYNFILEMNSKAREMGYLTNQAESTFLPFVRKNTAESLAWDYSLKPIVQFKNTIKHLADDVGYGKINEVTGELELGIPKYYTTDFSAENADGVNDYSEVSLETFKNLILYINHMNRYKYFSEIEGQVLLMRKLQAFKSSYVTGRYGKIQKEDGRFVENTKANKNVEMLDKFIATAMYGQKYPLDEADVILPSVLSGMKNVVNVVSRSVSGRDVFKDTDKPSVVSLTKTIDALNRYVQLKSLGFEPISGAKNSFGMAVQFSAQSGKYYKTREIAKYIGRFTGGLFGADTSSKDEQEMVAQLIDKFMPLKDDPTYEKLQKAGLTKLTRINTSDVLFAFFRYPEQVGEKSLLMAVLDNTMVEDGKLVNITDYVRNKYRTEDLAEYVKLEPKINEEIEELKKTRSINVTRKLENGELVIPGLDLNNLDELQRLTQVIRRIARTATGGTTEFDDIGANMSVWFRSLMVFRGWIPKLAETRFGRFNPIIDDLAVQVDESGVIRESYDVGRIRLWFDSWGAAVNSKTSNIIDVLTAQYNIRKGNEKGLELIDKLFEKYTKSYYERTGKEATITRTEFADLIRQNLYNEVKELRALLMLMGLAVSVGFMAPDDDEDRATKNRFRYFQRTLDGFISELSFFYNPAEMTSILSGGIPAISLFEDIERFIRHSRLDVTGFDYSNPNKTTEQVRKDAQPIKYLMKMFPGTKSLVTWLAAFDEDFAKEYNVTLPKTNR